MATRLYFSDTTVGPVTGFAGSTNWSNSAGMTGQARLLTQTPIGDPLTNRIATETTAAATNIGLRMHVSDELTAQTISGSFSCVIRGLEDVAAADNALQVIVRVLSTNGGTVRATLYAGQAAALNTTVGALGEEFATTAATRIIPSGTALSSFTCIDGDRLSVETGMRSYDVSATSDSTTLRYGSVIGGADFALTSGLTTDLNPWVEFSGAIAFMRHQKPAVPLRNAAVVRASTY